MPADPNNLIWIDMEMTGLQPDSDRVIEIAMLVTDPQLNVLATGPVLVIHQPDEVLSGGGGGLGRGVGHLVGDRAVDRLNRDLLEHGSHLRPHRGVGGAAPPKVGPCGPPGGGHTDLGAEPPLRHPEGVIERATTQGGQSGTGSRD